MKGFSQGGFKILELPNLALWNKAYAGLFQYMVVNVSGVSGSVPSGNVALVALATGVVSSVEGSLPVYGVNYDAVPAS